VGVKSDQKPQSILRYAVYESRQRKHDSHHKQTGLRRKSFWNATKWWNVLRYQKRSDFKNRKSVEQVHFQALWLIAQSLMAHKMAQSECFTLKELCCPCTIGYTANLKSTNLIFQYVLLCLLSVPQIMPCLKRLSIFWHDWLATQNFMYVIQVISSTPLTDLQLEDDEILLSFDVVSLFTNVPTNLAVETAKKRLTECGFQERTNWSLQEVCEELDLCMQAQCFTFLEKYFKHMYGRRMNSLLSPILANLSMEQIENKSMTEYHHPPKIWIRYGDDTLAVISQKHLQQFFNFWTLLNLLFNSKKKQRVMEFRLFFT